MDFEQTNNGVENTPEMETERLDTVQETVEAPVDQAPQAAPAKPANAAFADFAGKAKAKAKELAQDERIAKGVEKVKKVPKKAWIAMAAVLAVLIVGFFAYSIFSNTYKTPISLYMNYINDRTHKDPNKDELKLNNGLCYDELNAIYKIMKKSDDYEDELEYAQESWEDLVASLEEQFGDNYKFSYKIEEKEKLDKDDCKDYQDKIRSYGKSMDNSLDEYDDFDSDEWADMADDMGLSRANAKKYVKQMKNICKELRKAKVTAGYELDIIIKVKGSELDEPAELEWTVCVYKINGRWYTNDLPSMSSLRSRFN